MKIKSFISTIAALTAASAMAVSVSAVDWSQASYADNDPSTVKMLSQTADGITFTTSDLNGDIAKARITLDKVLANPDDYSKIATAEWTVTYKNVSKDYTNYQLSGGTYFVNSNSEGYKIEAETIDENDVGTWENDTYTITDKFTATETLEKDGEIVFMDWSMADIGSAGIEVTISDFKLFDASGAEIAQLGYGEYGNSDSTSEADEVTAIEETIDVEDTTVTDTPVPDNTIDNAKTGNTGIATALAAIACASSALFVTSKIKK